MASSPYRAATLHTVNALLFLLGLAVAAAWVGKLGDVPISDALSRVSPWLLPLALVGSLASMGVRFVRWQFLLRRAEVRVPTRQSLSFYLASLVGIATPAHVGEALRGLFLRRHAGVPLRVSVAVLVAERMFDLAALAILCVATTSDRDMRTIAACVLVAVAAVAALAAAAERSSRLPGFPPSLVRRILEPAAFAKSLAMSLAVWGAASTVVTAATLACGVPVGLPASADVFSSATLLGGLTLMPAGVGSTGTVAILRLGDLGVPLASGVAAVTVMRLATTGLWLSVAAVFLVRELRAARRAPPADAAAHFNEVAAEYDQQFTEHVWDHLLARKVAMIEDAVGDRGRAGTGGFGVDAGCGLGEQARAMTARGYRVVGIDAAHGLLRQARSGGVPFVTGSVLQLPFRDGSVDFVYTVGVLHHLPDTPTQEAACREILRVLRPGGRLVVHETNPRNLLFSFYMGYVFPVLRSIDEGTEWWITPDRWERMPGFRHVRTEWFTFLPDFLPKALLAPMKRLEGALERSAVRRYSAHYMAVLEKPSA